MIDSCHMGDVRDGLRAFIAAGIRAQTCVTSPPYWGLRDYGTGQWEGGDRAHTHDTVVARGGRGGSGAHGKQTEGSFPSEFAAKSCSCGAVRVDRQLGLEPTIAEYVANMVDVFRLVRDCLTDDGTLWLNLGDSYAGSWGAQSREHAGKHAPNVSALSANQVKAAGIRDSGTGSLSRTPGLKPKDLCGIPWRVAFALQADGWYLRSDIIWHKPNPMPESVTDRPTKAHEYLFLLTKSERYYFDAAAIAEPSADPEGSAVRYQSAFGGEKARAPVGDAGIDTRTRPQGMREFSGKRNRRTVWTIPTESFKDAHFATFPTALVEPCILAGSRTGDIVLDPFMGSGTVAQVAQSLSRRWIGCELNPAYIAMQTKRAAQLGLALA